MKLSFAIKEAVGFVLLHFMEQLAMYLPFLPTVKFKV